VTSVLDAIGAALSYLSTVWLFLVPVAYALYYLNRYRGDVEFDNIYVTDEVLAIDARREALGTPSVHRPYPQ
jgi:hypothetical protein